MTDPNGDSPIHILAGIIGAGTNLYNNWSNVVKNPWSAIGYVATGAVAGVVSLSPGGAITAAKITAAGNLLTDIASGNVPDINSASDLLGYAGSSIGNALDVAGAGKLAKLGATGLKSFGIDIIKDQSMTLAFSSISADAVESLVAEWYGKDVIIADAPTIFGKRSNFGVFASSSLFTSAGQAGFGQLGIHGNSVNSTKPAMVYNHTFTDGKGNFKTYTGVGDVEGKRAWGSVERIQNNNKGWTLYDSQTTIAPNRQTAYQLEQMHIRQNGGVKNNPFSFNKINSPGRKLLDSINKIF